jgi:Icc-related predicted phosphoesterase
VPKDILRIAAAGDIHCTRKSQGVLQPIFAQAAERADILLLCGDLCDYGLAEEAHVLAKEISRAVKIPVLAVLGNHDYEAGHDAEVKRILSGAGVIVLDGDIYEFGDVGFVGVKGFGGGFGRRMLEPWGESAIKSFVSDAVSEAMKLESALAKLRTRRRIVLMHYSPIEATVEGEPREIYPFLGSSRLEEPLNRYDVAAVFHGHAHAGSPEGHTREGVPIYNVAMPVLRRTFPNEVPFRFLEVPLGAADMAEHRPTPDNAAARATT